MKDFFFPFLLMISDNVCMCMCLYACVFKLEQIFIKLGARITWKACDAHMRFSLYLHLSDLSISSSFCLSFVPSVSSWGILLSYRNDSAIFIQQGWFSFKLFCGKTLYIVLIFVVVLTVFDVNWLACICDFSHPWKEQRKRER